MTVKNSGWLWSLLKTKCIYFYWKVISNKIPDYSPLHQNIIKQGQLEFLCEGPVFQPARVSFLTLTSTVIALSSLNLVFCQKSMQDAEKGMGNVEQFFSKSSPNKRSTVCPMSWQMTPYLRLVLWVWISFKFPKACFRFNDTGTAMWLKYLASKSFGFAFSRKQWGDCRNNTEKLFHCAHGTLLTNSSEISHHPAMPRGQIVPWGQALRGVAGPWFLGTWLTPATRKSYLLPGVQV